MPRLASLAASSLLHDGSIFWPSLGDRLLWNWLPLQDRGHSQLLPLVFFFQFLKAGRRREFVPQIQSHIVAIRLATHLCEGPSGRTAHRSRVLARGRKHGSPLTSAACFLRVERQRHAVLFVLASLG